MCARWGTDSAQRDGGGEGKVCIGGGRRSKGELNEVVWSGMEGLKSLSTSGRERGASSCSALRRACSADQSLRGKWEPRPFVARAKRRTRRGRSCFEGW